MDGRLQPSSEAQRARFSLPASMWLDFAGKSARATQRVEVEKTTALRING